MPTPTSIGRSVGARFALGAFLSLGGAVVGLALGELIARAGVIPPRVQIVRADTPALMQETWHGTPLWKPRSAEADLRNEDCEGERRVLFAGDSIFRTAEPGAARSVMSMRVAKALNEESSDICVHDVSQSGYFPYQQWAEAKRFSSERNIDILVFGVWKPAERYFRLGRDLYALPGLELDSAGFPTGAILPTRFHHWLFMRSRLYEAAALTFAQPRRGEGNPYSDYFDVGAWAGQNGMSVLFLEFPPLDKPFATSNTRSRELQTLADQLQEQGHRYAVVAERLHEEDVTAVRLDRCCHYNSMGHELLATLVLGELRSMLDGPTESRRHLPSTP